MTTTPITLREYAADLYSAPSGDKVTRTELRNAAHRALSSLYPSVPAAPDSACRAAYAAEVDFLVGVALDLLSIARNGGTIGDDAVRVWRTASAVVDLLTPRGTANQISTARRVAAQCREIQLAAEALASR